MDFLIDAKDLTDEILIDARSLPAFETIKGSIALNFETLADKSPAELSSIFSETGLNLTDRIAVFNDLTTGLGDDARLVEIMRACGFEQVRIVDGGWNALLAAGFETAEENSSLPASKIIIGRVEKSHFISKEVLLENYGQYKIIDVRSQAEYDGAILYGEAQGGHLPQACLIPFESLFLPNQKLLSKESLQKIFTAGGLKPQDEIVVYCTIGVRAAYMSLVLQMLGFERVKNYQQGFLEWSKQEQVEK